MEFSHQLSPACKSCFATFDLERMPRFQVQKDVSEWVSPYKLIIFSSYVFILFSSFAYILNIQIFCGESVNVFGIALIVFSNLFWKICTLFEKILTAYLKCCRASFCLHLVERRCTVSIWAERGGLNWPPISQEKLPSKSPAFLALK